MDYAASSISACANINMSSVITHRIGLKNGPDDIIGDNGSHDEKIKRLERWTRPRSKATYLRVHRMKLHMYPTMHHW